MEFIEQGLVRKMVLCEVSYKLLVHIESWIVLDPFAFTSIGKDNNYYLPFNLSPSLYNYASTYTPCTQPSQTQLMLCNCLPISDSWFTKLAAILLSVILRVQKNKT